MPNLPLASGLMETTKQSPKGYLGGKEVGPILEELKGAEAGAEQRVGEADVEIEQAKRQEKGAESEKKKLLYERLGTEARELPERKALGEAREKLQEMAFVPTKETAQDLAAMFSLMSVVGMVAGKGNAQLAMSAMNGMLEGHQKGQADLYKKQQVEFDKNFKAMQSKISTLEKQVSEAMELKKYDKEAGEQEINMALAQAESPLLKAMKDKVGDVAVLNAVRGVRKDVDTLVGLQNNLQKAADDRQARKDAIVAANERARQARIAADERARLQRENALKIAQTKGATPKALKKGEFQAQFIGEIIGRPVDPDAAQAAAQATTYKQQLKELGELNQKLGGAPGLKVAFVESMNRFLATKTKDGFFDPDALLPEVQQQLENDKSFRAMSDTSKLMAKKELDAVFTALKMNYGNRAPVTEFNQQSKVLNRSNMTPTAFNNIVGAQTQAADNRMMAMGYKPKDILALNKYFVQNRGELDLLSGVEDETDTGDISPYEFETEAEAEEFLRSTGMPEVRARVGGQVGTVTLPTR
jgi:hypothetical protein